MSIPLPDLLTPFLNQLRHKFSFQTKLIGLGFSFGVLLIAQSLPAQSKSASQQIPKTGVATQKALSSYEGQNVTAVEIAGRPDLQNDDFVPLFVQKNGQPFSSEKLDQTVTALKESGKLKEVQVQVQPEPDGVKVLLVLEPAIYIGVFQFPGAEQFAYSRLVQVADFPSQAPFNAGDIERDRLSLVNFFRQEGYFEAKVETEVKVESRSGVANVIFHVTLGQRAKFGTVLVDGVPPEEAAHVRASLTTLVARGRGAAIRTGKSYHRSTLDKATHYLQSQLQKRGRLNAEVELAGAEFHQERNQADIHFSIHPGPPIRVDIEGAHLWSWTRKSLLPVYQGIAVDDESVQEGQQSLTSYYQAKGFFDVKVDSESRHADNGDLIIYRIARGKKRKVSQVDLAGNTHISSAELAPRLTVEKSHLFSPGNFSDKLVRSSVKNLEAVYQAQGYSSVTVASKVESQGPDIKVIFTVDEGPRDIVNSLQIEGADTFPESSFAPQGLQLASGKPYSQTLVQQDRANIIANYLKAGYLISSFRQTAKVVSKNEPHRIDVVYHIYEGPKVYASGIFTLGRVNTKQRLIDQDVAPIKIEKPLTETELLTAESQLYNHTGVFDWAEVDPKRSITTQTREDVLVKVHEAKRNQINYGFGFEIINRGGNIPSGTVAVPNLPPVGLPSNFTTNQQTFIGPRGTFQYTRNNVLGKGETLSFTGFAGRLDQRAAAYYINPNFRWSPWRSTASFSAERDEENPVFSDQVYLGSYQIQRSIDKANAVILFLRYSFSKTDLTRLEIPELVLPADQHVRLSTLSANLTRDTRDNTLDEHKGVLQTLEFDFNTTKLGSSVDFAKMTAQAAYYKPLPHSLVWANSIRIGLAQPFANSRVPLSEAFFTGGGNTLRGFPFDGAGPQRSVPVCSSGSTTDCTLIQVPGGGNELLLINSEIRLPLPIKKGLGIVAFYDGGNVFPLVGFHDFTSLYSNNVGLGLRYATPVGPVRIDLGRNLNPVPGIQATQYFISIGQAF